MTDNKKIETIEKAISSLEVYKKGLKDGNIQNFEKLKSKILNVLTENEKIRFSQIEFYSEQVDFDNIMNDDDLPF
jgi:cell division ATPase FtsA